MPVETTMDLISFEDFLKVELRVGRIVSAEKFPEAKKTLISCRSILDRNLAFEKRARRSPISIQLKN